MFFRLPDEVDERLRRLPGVYARANAALRFNSWVSAEANMLGVREEELSHMSAACLRAALSEFSGMEETLRSDLPSGVAPLRIRDTKNAMLVVLRELRNVQIHVVRTELESSTRAAYSVYDGTRHDHELTALTIPIADIEKLRGTRNLGGYVRADVDAAVEWLLQAQQHWGFPDVLMRGIWDYGKAIVNAHVSPLSEQPG